MSIIRTVFYILFAVSIAAPVYTYAVYPFVLKLFRRKKYISDNSFKPQVSVVIFSDVSDTEKKIINIMASDYPSEKLDISVIGSIAELNRLVSESKSDFILFTDSETELDTKAVSKLISGFADNRIGCVCGQLHKKPDKDGKPTDSTFWKYENKVKRLESGIGRLSGANNAIYAVRRSILPQINENIINLDFYISTYVLQAGWDVVMAEDAVAYEAPEKADGTNFDKHVNDGAGYYQALKIFRKLLLPRKGSFTYVSHRVIKWLVPANLIFLFVTSAVLSFYSAYMLGLFLCQIAAYGCMGFYYRRFVKRAINAKGKIVKVLSAFFYFILLNLALMSGFFQLKRKQQKTVMERKR